VVKPRIVENHRYASRCRGRSSRSARAGRPPHQGWGNLRFHEPCAVTSDVFEDRRRHTGALGLSPLLRTCRSAIHAPFDPVVPAAERLHHRFISEPILNVVVTDNVPVSATGGRFMRLKVTQS